MGPKQQEENEVSHTSVRTPDCTRKTKVEKPHTVRSTAEWRQPRGWVSGGGRTVYCAGWISSAGHPNYHSNRYVSKLFFPVTPGSKHHKCHALVFTQMGLLLHFSGKAVGFCFALLVTFLCCAVPMDQELGREFRISSQQLRVTLVTVWKMSTSSENPPGPQLRIGTLGRVLSCCIAYQLAWHSVLT